MWKINVDQVGQSYTSVTGWLDFYSESYIWPPIDTLSIPPASITVQSSGAAARQWPHLMGEYLLDTSKASLLKPVYRKDKERGSERVYYINYNGNEK